jgi:serine/threonine protein kinase
MEGKQVAVLPRVRPPGMITGMASSAGSLIPLGARSFGKYELLARLATGGMAEIFLARRRDGSEADGSVLVIKRVLPHLADDARFVAMFRDEARLAARIEHQNVCRVLDSGSVGDTYFIAMEYLHGMPLSRVLVRAARSGVPLDLRLIAGIMVQCCAGLHHAHQLLDGDGRALDVVHRDVSPPNIFVTAAGVVKILDFGVAKAHGASEKTRTGTVKGKNAYMSPEQVLGQPMDRRSDIFSLGIVLWEALSAQRLFMREVDFETFRAITEGDVPEVRLLRADTPSELAEVVHQALSLRPDQRFASAAALGDAVAAAVVGIGGPAGEREISAFIQERFASELISRVQLLDATGGRADDAPPARGRDRHPTADISPDGDTVVSGTPGLAGDVTRNAVEIRWSQSRKTNPMKRITTGSMRRVTTGSMKRVTTGSMKRVTTGSLPRIDDSTSPSEVLAQGSRPRPELVRATVASGSVTALTVSGMVPGPRARQADPRSMTMRVRALPAPPRPAPVTPPPEETGQEAAAVVFIAGVFALLVVLWWLL